MIEADQHLTTASAVSADASAPALPVEGHIVAAALSIEELRGRALALGWYVRHLPRDTAAIEEIFRAAQTELSAAWSHYDNYRQVLSCRGSA